ncbi:DUF3231 family protein [Ornithinibacillus contaminans]|uniref:DUF3231 family protein n=1 Tax=Ornithinibacillus contaminans TaxID=694055 RepID=UPI000A3E8F5A|nr:DUF3231 family protein [Ornithinibacillus contaminans]
MFKASSMKKSNLTAAEVSGLWVQFMGDTMAICIYKYFLSIVENEELKSILHTSLQLAEGHIKRIKELFESEGFPIPIGFTSNDVNLHAPRLFTDQFIIFYSYIMTIHGMTAYSLALSNSERSDIQNYFNECSVTSNHLFQKIMALLKKQPKHSSVPPISPPDQLGIINSIGMISNLIGDKRPLNSSEVSNLFFNSTKTGFISTLSLGFSQVASREEVRNFMLKNVKLARKDAESFDNILQQDNLPTPEKWDDQVTDATISPFSDKLMMFHAAFLVNTALSYYGAALGSSLRSDVMLNYLKVYTHATEAGVLCYKIMVKYKWLEEQPRVGG